MEQYQIKTKLQETFIVQPNDLGIAGLTHIYKSLTKLLKTAPFIYLIPLAFLLVLAIYFIFGVYLVRLVSQLQHGF